MSESFKSVQPWGSKFAVVDSKYKPFKIFDTEGAADDYVRLMRGQRHPQDCKKAPHDSRGGYLHESDDDLPYDVDGCLYCGRCHLFLKVGVKS